MTVVFKLGGSLLSLAGLANQLHLAMNQRRGEKCLVLTGGGATTDVVRDWSQTHQLTEEVAHWLAISSLDLNRQLLSALLSWKTVATRSQAADYWNREASPLLLDFGRFVREEEQTSVLPLPHHWDVTSDSLAAWTARSWPAVELVLLKSISLPQPLTLHEAAHAGYVDPYFPHVATGLQKISWCNLRGSTVTIEPWCDSA